MKNSVSDPVNSDRLRKMRDLLATCRRIVKQREEQATMRMREAELRHSLECLVKKNVTVRRPVPPPMKACVSAYYGRCIRNTANHRRLTELRSLPIHV